MHHMVNRTDAYGRYLSDGTTITAKDGLHTARLTAHFRGESTVGLHLIGTDNLCRFTAWDFDQHDEADPQAVAARNLDNALSLVAKLEQLGMYPLLEDSDGKGGFHVWVFFDRPRPARDVYRWAREMAPEGCEAFPKQRGVAPGPGKGHYGNYIRLPGRHHKRPHWSRFYIAGDWYEGNDAVDLVLGWTPSQTDCIPVEPEDQAPLSPPPPEAHLAPGTHGLTKAMEAQRHLNRLKPSRADDYDDWLHIGMILHDIDQSEAMLAVWDEWSKQSSRYNAGVCAQKWATFDGQAYAANNGGKRLTIATLVSMANQDSGPEQVAPRTPASVPPAENPAEATDPFKQVGPHGIVLEAIEVVRTNTRYTAKFDVQIDDTTTDMDLTASDTSGGLRMAWSSLNEIIDLVGKKLDADSEKEVNAWLKKVLARRSLERLHRLFEERRACDHAGDARDDRPTMQEIATDFMRKHLDLRFIVAQEMAVWSEHLGVPLRQSEFTGRIEPGLLEAIRSASDYAAPTPSDPTKPIKQLQQVLKPVWCAVSASLPREVNADLGPESKAAALFRRSILALWLTPETWMKFDATADTAAHVERMSLASRVRETIHFAEKRDEQWQRVLKGVNAFFRVQRVQGSAPLVWLGMRADLCHGEIKGRVLPGVETQHDLSVLANRYGVADTSGVPVHITDEQDRRRLLVLNRSLCDQLVHCDDADEAPLRAGNEAGATEVRGGERIDTATGEVLDAT